jgi:autotransporter translocation and assembly factor TamB
MRKTLKYLLAIIALLLGLILLILVATQTAPFRNLVRKKLITTINNQLNGTLALEQLSGNFFSTIELNHASLTSIDGDTLAQFDQLSLNYSLLSLRKGTIRIDSIILQSPRVHLTQGVDSIWNFEKLFPPSAETDTSASKPFNLFIDLRSFILSEGHINIGMPDTLVPHYISHLNIALKGQYSSNTMLVELEHFRFQTPPHIPDLNDLQVSLARKDSLWTLKNLVLITPRNKISSLGEYKDVKDFSASLSTQDLHPDEFSFYLPEFRLGVTPVISFRITSHADKLFPELNLTYQNQELRLSGDVTRFADLLTDTTRHLADLNLLFNLKNFSPEKWFSIEDMPAILNGNLSIKGNGLPGSSKPLELNANLSDSRWAQYKFSELVLHSQYSAGETRAQASINIGNGRVTAEAFTNLSDSLSPFVVTLKSAQFRADPFLPEWGDSTLLTFQLKANGKGLLSQSPQGRFSLAMQQSVAARVPIDTLWLTGHYLDHQLVLDTLRLLNPSLLFNAHGTLTPDQRITTRLTAEIYNLDSFKPYFVAPAKWEKLSLAGTAHGTADSMHIQLEAEALNADYDTLIHAGHLRINSEGLLTPNGFTGPVNMTVKEALVSGQVIDSLKFNAALLPDAWDAAINLSLPNALSLNTEARGNMGSPLEIHIARLELSSPEEQFQLEDKGADLLLDSTTISVKNLHLIARSDSLFQMHIDGEYQASKTVELVATIRHFDLNTIYNLGFTPTPIDGTVDLMVNARGPLSQPTLQLQGTIDDLRMDPLNIKKVTAALTHDHNLAQIRFTVQSESGDSLALNAQTPIRINLTDSQMVSTIREVDARLLATHVNPKNFFIPEGPEQQSIDGILNTDIRFSGNITAPNLSGYLRFSNGKFSMPAYGIQYNNIKLITTLSGHRIALDSLYTRDKDGDLLVTGDAVLDTALLSGNIASLNARIKAHNFYVSRHNNHKIQVNSDIQLKDSARQATFGGDLTVLRSNFYLPGLMEMSETSTINEPLLVKALKETRTDSLVVDSTDNLSMTIAPPNTSAIRNLTGKLNIQIPRNTWIKSEDMSLEIFGDVDLLKNNDYFELFGSLGISRGFYTLYGRKLVIQEGEINFQGGEDLDPLINIKATYQFRGKDKQKNEMIMAAAGSLTEPELSFTLNNKSITERDAMAYLIFNQSFDELSFSNQEGVSGNVPQAMLTSLVSSQLTKTVGNTFDLDMVEINANEDWQSATFMVGKYITNNLFVTYQRGFGENKDESLTPQIITLEYELNRHIFFRLTQGEVKDSGVDIIFKFEKNK